ncbi:MAG: GFA family protein [Hyphomonas sp.]
MLEGSCFCGAVAYRVESIGPIGHCHCRTCQKTHAAAFATTARSPRSGFAWTTGAEVVASIESTPGKLRHFCPRCGSHLVAEWKDQDAVILRVASLDTPLLSKPVLHIWTSHQAAFFDFDDGLPRLPEGVPRPPES